VDLGINKHLFTYTPYFNNPLYDRVLHIYGSDKQNKYCNVDPRPFPFDVRFDHDQLRTSLTCSEPLVTGQVPVHLVCQVEHRHVRHVPTSTELLFVVVSDIALTRPEVQLSLANRRMTLVHADVKILTQNAKLSVLCCQELSSGE